MAIRLIQALVPTHPINRVFDFDPPLGKGAIECDIFRWAIFPRGLRLRAQPVGMGCYDAHVGQITDRADAVWQAFQHLRLLSQQ